LASKAVQAHGITTKFIPFIFVLVAFLYIFEITSEPFLIFEPEDMFMFLAILFGSLVFIYEAFQSREGGGHSVAFVLLIVIGIIGLIFAFAILFGLYDAIRADSDFIKFTLTVVLIAMLIILGAGAINEIVLSKRLRLHKVIG